MIARLRGVYGEGSLHLLGHLAFFALTAYVVVQLADARSAFTILLWVVGAALIHDLVFLPVYAIVDRTTRRAIPRLSVPIVNHVRFVVVVTGALFVVWFPTFLGKANDNIARNAGIEPGHYLRNWLMVTAGLAALSAIAYGVRVVRARRVEQLHDPVGLPADEDPPRA